MIYEKPILVVREPEPELWTMLFSPSLSYIYKQALFHNVCGSINCHTLLWLDFIWLKKNVPNCWRTFAYKQRPTDHMCKKRVKLEHASRKKKKTEENPVPSRRHPALQSRQNSRWFILIFDSCLRPVACTILRKYITKVGRVLTLL